MREKAKKKRLERMMSKVNEDLLNNTLEETSELTEETPQTFSDMLAPLRENIKQEKTDAVKMQRYHALTDALGALGKIGGAAIGGAIGGNVMDSAPVVGEYQPSRGYVTAFEKAKNANDRLRAIDEKEFQLKYDQKQKQAEMDWQKELAEYNAQQKKQMAAEANEYERQLQREVSMRNFYQKQKLAEIEANNALDLQKLRNAGALDEKKAGLETSKWQADTYNSVPIAFNDGTGIRMSKNDYEGMLRFFNGKKIGNITVNKNNIDTFLRDNPKLVNDYITAVGGASVAYNTRTKDANNADATNPYNPTSFLYYNGLDAYNQLSRPHNLVETNPEDDINKEEFKNTFASLKQ